MFALCVQTQALVMLPSQLITMTEAKAAVGLSPMEDVKEMTIGSRLLKTA